MLMPDAGPVRRAPEPQLRPDIQVDPGDLQDFAKFLDQMLEEVTLVELQMKRYADEEPGDFGQHRHSKLAQHRHDAALHSAYNNVQILRKRLTGLVEGTTQLSKQYTDLDELNRAAAADVAALITRQQNGDRA